MTEADYFPARLKALRELRGMTQRRLDKAAGVGWGSVNKWENGREPSLGSLLKLAQGLRVPVLDLLPQGREVPKVCPKCEGRGIVFEEEK